ncbi:phage terminase large subunit [Magnetococcales bacterium HHB-1]
MLQSELRTINLELHAKQGLALTTEANEVLYGGAAGGGKSHLMRVAAIMWCAAIPGLQVYLFRRLFPDLIKNHMDGPKGFRSLLSGWSECGFVKIVEGKGEIRFSNGSKVYLCHCKDEKDRFKYQGSEIHVLMIDELTHFTELIYRFLRGRLRMSGVDVPLEYQGKFPRIICGSNPGNIGHLWVKRFFIDDTPPLTIRQMEDDEGGLKRQYIPARLEDNPSMTKDDPAYRARLRGLGSSSLVKAMEYGDWNVVDGAYFDCWSTKDHVLPPKQLPKNWLRFRSFDWGSARPFSVGWWAVSDGMLPEIPKGALVRYREWYGAKGNNEGLKLTAEAVAQGIFEREKGENIVYGVADPAIFAADGGPSLAERMRRACGINWRGADNQRLPGWDQLRSRLVGEDGKPMIYCFSTCVDSIRTIPALQHDVSRVEDLDSNSEDHAADEWRYACMSRPYVPIEGSYYEPKPKPGSFDWLIREEVQESRSAYRL